MLTSNNQYLRPEYLTPLPTTLDAKKSPLALLAQTCSQIGADTPNNKLLQSADKNKSGKDSSSSRDKGTSDVAGKFGQTREKSKTPDDRSSTTSTGSRVRSPQATKNSILNNGRCGSNHSTVSPSTTPEQNERKSPIVDVDHQHDDRSPPLEKNVERASPHGSTKTAFTPNILTSSSDPAIKDLPLGTFKPGVPVSTAFLPTYPTPGFPIPMDLMTNSLISQHHALKTGGLNPYVSYSRLKTQDSMSSVCRDPYCTGCSVSAHLLGASANGKPSSCPSGCSQCDHTKPPTTNGYLGHNAAVAAYAHAQLAALAAASHLPYVCNWISGDATYCGKRFSSSEELLGHLRTHTSVVTDTNATLSMLSTSGLSPTHPLLHRTYPTPPLSPMATARYHPYTKPSLLPPSLSSSSLSGFSLSHPNLSPYLSPYSLYGPRMGAPPGMHP